MAAFFTELFRIKPSEVEVLLSPDLDPQTVPSLWLRNLGDLELVGLWDSLPNAESEGTLLAKPLSDVDGEQLVVALPDNFLALLSELSDEQLMEVAKRWSAMEELADWNLSDLAQVIRDIRRLIQEANARGQIVVQLCEL